MTGKELGDAIKAINLSNPAFATLIGIPHRRLTYLIYSLPKVNDLDYENICKANINSLSKTQQSIFRTYFLEQNLPVIENEPSKDLVQKMIHSLRIELAQEREYNKVLRERMQDKMDECDRYKKIIDDVLAKKKIVTT